MRRARWLAIAAACGALAAVWATRQPATMFRGWLAAFIFVSSLPLGAVALRLIHAMTGGRWGAASEPALSWAAFAALLPPLFFLVVLFGLRSIYAWESGADDVERLYLNADGFALRGEVALLGWALLGWLASTRTLSPLAAGLALVFHGVAVSFVANDWALSIDAHYDDSAIGMELAVQQLLVALAFVGLTQPGRVIEIARGDVGGLMFATALGGLYLGYMTFVVKWYGDQPTDAAWWIARSHGASFIYLLCALLFAAIVPLAGLAWSRLRETPAALRIVSASALIGVAAHDLWLLDASALELISCGLATIAMSALALGLAPSAAAPPPMSALAEVSDG